MFEALRDRALMLQKARAFFAAKGVLEVDCPALGLAAPVDRHIEVMQVQLKHNITGYLHTSPEYGMKRLLSEGIGDIYQISHVFRDGEIGPLHNPEFTMAEWYRCGFTFQEIIAETCDFIRLFLGDLPSEQITYKDAFSRYLHCDYTSADLHALAQAHGASADARFWDRDTLLQYLMSLAIEPHLGKECLLALTHYPASQSALAKTAMHGDEPVAYRFEIFYNGMELANGYHELTDPVEQRQRFESANAVRIQEGKQALAIDEKFLASLNGLPDCCGVAVGFDRLMLLRHKATRLSHILPISWDKL